jgi:DNA polymerase-3 subunit epsilon
MNGLICVKPGLFVNPDHIVNVSVSEVEAHFDMSDREYFTLTPAQWLNVKDFLVLPECVVTHSYHAAGCTCGRQSVTAQAIEEILVDEEKEKLMAEYRAKQERDHAELLAQDLARAAAPHDDSDLDDLEGDEDFEDDEEAAGPVDTDLSRLIQVVQSGNFVILDTETTGLNGDAEICQISIIDAKGNALLDTLVKPQKSIPADAQRIHGITNDMVKTAPDWINVNEAVWQACKGKTVIVYNADYDFRLIAQSEKACDPLALSDWHTINRECAMLAYAEYRGVWNDYHGNYKWHKLSDAAARVNYSLPAGMKAHSALADCLMTLAVCKKLAGL